MKYILVLIIVILSGCFSSVNYDNSESKELGKSAYLKNEAKVNLEKLLEKTDMFEYITYLSKESFYDTTGVVEIRKISTGYSINFLPKNPYKGGSGICVYLRFDFSYENHADFSLEPAP